MTKESMIITKAPGKVLISGGYGVLQQNNYGLALAVNSYFYCICTHYSPCSQQSPFTDISINSFQIQQSIRYIYDQQSTTIKQINNKINPFVQNAVYWTLVYFKNISKVGKINLQIVFTKNFLSHSNQCHQQQQFILYNKYNNNNKTGLGSSACVIVTIIKCLTLLFLQQYKYPLQNINKLINVLSQFANLSAQKKIGSNFDISTAIFGTHLYKNILPYKIINFISQFNNSNNHILINQLVNIQIQIMKIIQPKYQYYSYIVDVNRGTDTRIMVKNLINQLKKCDADIIKKFYETSKQITLSLHDALKDGSIHECKQINRKHRKFQQQYSQLTKVQIQPKQLSTLLDQIMQIDNVIYVICPGSGGYDAIFVVCLQEISKQLKNKIGNHNIRSVSIQFEQNFEVSIEQRQKVLNVLNTVKNTQ